MYRCLKSVSIAGICSLAFLSPIIISGNTNKKFYFLSSHASITPTMETSPASVLKKNTELVLEESHSLYETMKLQKIGLTMKAFEYAWKGYRHLLEKGKIENTAVISICDFSQSSRRKRLYIIDIQEKKVLVNTYVAHGRNSGGEYARSFSNNPESHKSSLGFYITGESYYGSHGLALKIEGLEKGINDKADERNIVIHGSDYVGEKFLSHNRFNGRSFGCPAVPSKQSNKIINTIKDGSCLFIYYPTKYYLTKSRIING